MVNVTRIIEIDEIEKKKFIEKLVDELPVLRLKVGLSQDELASIVGISRQTYSSIETKKRKMSWSLFLSLILVFDYNIVTHDIIRAAGVFPEKLLSDADIRDNVQSFIKLDDEEIKNHLDEQAIHAIETVIMVEYARCNNMTSEAVIKAFNGKRVFLTDEEDEKIRKALAEIKTVSE